MIETINKMNRISRQILQSTGAEPDPSVLAEKMEMPEDKIRKIMKIAKEPISMETPIGDDDDSHLGDFIEDGANTAPIEAAMQAGLRDVVKEILDGLTPREAKVLRMRFGIEMDNDHTLEEVGKQFDVTRERIRQIEAKALREGNKLQERFRSGETIEQAHIDTRECTYLYKDDNGFTFMDKENFEQLVVGSDVLDPDQSRWLQDGMEVEVSLHEGTPVGCTLPKSVILAVVEADAVVKGQTASSSYKPAMLDNGVRIMVPPHIESGTRIIVDVYEQAYVKRAD